MSRGKPVEVECEKDSDAVVVKEGQKERIRKCESDVAGTAFDKMW